MALAVVSVTHTAFTTDTTAHLVAMPATVNAGDLLITFFANDGSATLSTPAGWTNLSSVPQSTVARGSISAKIAVGTEGGTTIDYVTSAAEQAAAQVYRITGAMDVLTVGTTITAGTAVGSANVGVATIDAPAVTASWGVLGDPNLFITYAAASGTHAIVNQPTGWSTPEKTSEGGYGQGAASAECFSSWLISASATLDPASWTTSATGAVTVSNTIVVRPKMGTLGVPVNTLAGATVNATTQALSIPAVAAGRILLITSHGRRASTTLAPDDPTLADSSAVPLTWTPVFAPTPVMISVNPSTKAQWWWAVADGAAKTVTLTWGNVTASWASVASFSIGAGLTPNFLNQTWAANSGTPATVTATYPIAPTTGINFLSFYGAGGSTSTIATGYTSLTSVASTPYRTGYDITPGNDAVMGGSFPDQILCAVNITDVFTGPVGAKMKAWDGSDWVERPLMRWSGSAWLQEAPKVWSGVAWVSSALPPLPGPAGPTASVLASFTPGANRNDFTGEVGVRYGIGGADIPVTWLGVYCGTGSGTRTVRINEWFADANLRTVTVDMAGVAPATWVWTAITPLTLLANGYYSVLQETTASDGLQWSNADVNAIAIGASSILNLYSCYRVPAGALNANTVNAMYVGLDLGW